MGEFWKQIENTQNKKKLTQQQLADLLGLTKSVISAYENGLRYPAYDVLIKIARIFKVSTDFLLGVEIKREIDTSGLTDEQVEALIVLIDTIRNNN
ncbi:MAG: XRE family transcriptional regulator [Ruminococcaceae bacterium]|nr:XRE family transcriptional regulator [Oscillospiraceae bacterium]MBE5713643.1 XRE family transcriptional regulator [Oscillospiraceae bacterium]